MNEDYKWYILKTKANCEMRAKQAIEKTVQRVKMANQVREIMIPERDVVQVVNGKKVTRSKRIYPGYVFIEMKLDRASWHNITAAANVSHFIGGGKPLEVPKEQLDMVNQKVEDSTKSPKVQVSFSEGESVKVIDGPFKSFNGIVEEVNQEKGRVKVSVSIFGRPTPVDFDFAQVYKEM